MHTYSHKRSTHKRGPRRLLLALAAFLLASCGANPTPQVVIPTAIPAATSAPTIIDAAPPTLPAEPATAPAAATPAAGQPAETQGPPVPLTGQGQTFQVDATDNAFSPADLTVPAGSKVVWTNKGQRSHTVTADDGSFTSGTLKSGDVFEHVFDQPGTFLYYCEFHGGSNGQAMAGAVSVTAAAAQPAAPAPPAQGFTLTGGLNRDPSQPAFNPAVTAGTTQAGGPLNLWVTWAESSPGNVRQIFAGELVSGALQPRGASINIHANVVADFPTITFAGENRLVPWVAWTEPSPGFGNVAQVFASRFNAASGLWQQAGQDRGGNEASLNLHTNRAAAHAFVFGGSGDQTKPPVPWVTWEELSGQSNVSQIFVARGVKDDTAIGGFHWEFVGQLNPSQEPSLNVDRFRNSLHPTGVFAETGNTVPWITWSEGGGDRPERIFTARGVADAKTPGGFKWINVPACTPDETACALNVNPLKDAREASMASGSVTPGEAGVPWIAWVEVGPSGKTQVLVSRLDLASRNSFLPVGGSLNIDQNHNARTPFITFEKNVPYVSWLEEDGSGKLTVQVRHLSSDPQTGTWTLDTQPGGVRANPALPVSGLFAAGSDEALFLAWTEGDPTKEAAQLVTAVLRP